MKAYPNDTFLQRKDYVGPRQHTFFLSRIGTAIRIIELLKVAGRAQLHFDLSAMTIVKHPDSLDEPILHDKRPKRLNFANIE